MKYAAIAVVAVIAIIAYRYFKKNSTATAEAPRSWTKRPGQWVEQIPVDILTSGGFQPNPNNPYIQG